MSFCRNPRESFATPEINITVTEENKFAIVDAILARCKDEFTQAKIVDIDGVRVEFDDGWALVRASNTTPCLVLRFEADTQEAMDSVQSRFMTVVNSVL